MIPEQTSDANQTSEAQRPLAKDATGNVYTCGSQVNVGPVKRVGMYTTTDPNAPKDQVPNVSDAADASLNAIRNAAGPRGETTNDENAGA